MAEVVILELVLDPSKLQEGAKAASDALGGLGDKAKATGESVKQSGNAIKSAFAATGGTVQISAGIASAATAFGQLNTQAGLFGASRTILELGRTAEDFARLGRSIGATTGALGLLGRALGPIAIGVSIISAITAAVGLFASNTRNATGEVEALGDAIMKTKVNAAIGETSGDDLVGNARLAAIKAALPGTYGGRATDANELTQLAGGKDDYMRLLAQAGNERARMYAEKGFYYDQTGAGPMKREGASAWISSPTAEESRYVLETAGRSIIDERKMQALGKLPGNYPNRGGNAAWLGPVGPGYENMEQAAGLMGPGGIVGPAGAGVRISEEDQLKVTEENAKKAQHEMDLLVTKAERFGSTIGDAFFNVASGAQTARQAIQGLIADMARAASREAFAGLFGQVAKGFGKTAAQSAGDAAFIGPPEATP